MNGSRNNMKRRVGIIVAIFFIAFAIALLFQKTNTNNKNLSALLLVGTRTAATLPELYHNPSKKIRLLLVPGHDNENPGAVFQGLKEADINALLAEELQRLFQKNSKFEVFLARTKNGYAPQFKELFAKQSIGIKQFREYVQYYAKLFQRNDIVQQKNTNMHSTAKPESAIKLYGINWWANSNNIDLILHIHFNDYPRKRRSEGGTYYGFAIYYPESQLPNHDVTKQLAQSLHSYLKRFFIPSNLPKENGGLVESQELIATGSFGSLESAALLIEYAYIYEPILHVEETRERFIKNLAIRTYEGIVEYLKTAGK